MVDAVHSFSQQPCVLGATVHTVRTPLGSATPANALLQRYRVRAVYSEATLDKISCTFKSEDRCGVPWPYTSGKMVICSWHMGGRQVEG